MFRHLLSIVAVTLFFQAGFSAQARDSLTIGITQFPSTLNPAINAMLAKSYVLAMARRTVSIIGPDWKPVCEVCTELPTFENDRAKKYELEDGSGKFGVFTTYTIRDDAFWGDGTPVTTKDVLFTWNVGKHPKTGVANRSAFEDIVDIQIADEKTFTLKVQKLTYDYSALGGFPLMPAHLEEPAFSDPQEYRHRTLYDTDPTNPGLYNGPYRIVEVASGSHITLARNEHWKGQSPQFDRITVRAIENTAALEANLLSGSIDYIAGELGLTLDQALAFEKRHGDKFDITYKPGLIYEHIDLMLDNPVLQDIRVRRALLHAIDRDAVSTRLFQGKQPVAHGFVNPLDWTYNDGIRKYPFDPKLADKLLDEAGWTVKKKGIRHNSSGERLSLEIMSTAGNRIRELVEQVLQNYWKRVGIDVRIRNQPPRVLFGETIAKRKFTGLAMYAWLSSPESLPRTTLYSTSIPTAENNWAGQNNPGFKNSEMDELIDAIEIELDREKRKALWARAQEIYAEELPVLPLYYRANAYVFPKWLKGVVPTGHQFSTTHWIENWRVE